VPLLRKSLSGRNILRRRTHQDDRASNR